MSGFLGSRFQGRFGYDPSMRVGFYPVPNAAALPASVTGQGGAAAPAATGTPATQQNASTPVSAGASAPPQQGGGGNTAPNSDAVDNYGQTPGSLSGFGAGSYGTIGAAIGGLASLAGMPGGMAIGSTIGTIADVNAFNGMLSDFGLAPNVDMGSALGNAATMGMAGRGAEAQFADAFAPAVPSTLADFTDVGGTGGLNSEGGTGPDGGSKGDTGSDPGGVDGASGHGADNSSGGNEAGWMAGGYTGAGHDGAVQPDQPAGTVHEGEIVIPAAQVKRYGVPLLMGLVNGTVAPSKLRTLAGLD